MTRFIQKFALYFIIFINLNFKLNVHINWKYSLIFCYHQSFWNSFYILQLSNIPTNSEFKKTKFKVWGHIWRNLTFKRQFRQLVWIEKFLLILKKRAFYPLQNVIFVCDKNTNPIVQRDDLSNHQTLRHFGFFPSIFAVSSQK